MLFFVLTTIACAEVSMINSFNCFISSSTVVMAEMEENFGEPDMDQLPEDSQSQEKRGRDDDLAIGGGEKRWPGWPGESVFRMLVPAQKVGSIIGRKGEFIKKIVEETRARIKILDGPPGTAERAVS